MNGEEFWIIENNQYRRCNAPEVEFCSVASLHNHSIHSIERLSSLNRVVAMPFMRPFSAILQRAFGLQSISDLDYSDLQYNPPLAPTAVLRVELESVRQIGFQRLVFALTDHNQVSGCLELLDTPLIETSQIGLGEELSVRFQNHLFHLGIHGLPADGLLSAHNRMQAASNDERLGDLFEELRSTGCMVILNHPLLSWNGGSFESIPVLPFVEQYGWAIDALEYNGMRSRRENDGVIRLARETGKPLVGGGDSHFLTASSALSVSRSARSMADYIQEIKEGQAITLIREEYAAPMNWKIFLRVIGFIAQYRKIACYKELPIERVIGKDMVLLDPVGFLARLFLRLVESLNLLR
jgi:hypothetical protein